MSRVFVVTPTYCTEGNRRLPLLLQTLYWVRQQTHRDYLHIVVDDGSTDSTPEVLERLSRTDPKLRVFRRENGGSSAAVNHGVDQALASGRPEFITVCHSDDVLLPESLEVRVQLASKSGAKLVYTDEVVLYDTGAAPSRRRAPEHSAPDDLYEALLRHQAIPYTTMFWDADFFLRELHGYDERLTSSEDWDIALRSAKSLAAMHATHATAHRVTVARRKHGSGLRIQNLRDGTKRECYEMILRKHLRDDEYRAALARERRTNLRPPRLLRLKGMLRRLGLLSSRAHPNETEMDPRTEEFLREMDAVDPGSAPDLVPGARGAVG